jgi:hypothetical protein
MSITSSNANLTLGVTGLFPVAQKMQGFAADNIYDTEALEQAETMMGVDGILSGGYVYNPVSQGISLMADSPSVAFFDSWIAAMRQAGEIYTAFGVTFLPGTNRKYAHTKGFLVSAPIMPDAKKVLQPRKFTIRWESVLPAPV